MPRVEDKPEPAKRRWRVSIRTQYTLVVATAVLVVAAVLIVTGYLQARRNLIEMASEQMRQASELMANQIESFFTPAAVAARILTDAKIREAPEPQRAELFLHFAEAIMDSNPEIFAIKVGLPDGTFVRSVRADPEVLDVAEAPAEADTKFVRQIIDRSTNPDAPTDTLLFRLGAEDLWEAQPHAPPFLDPRDGLWYRIAQTDAGVHWSRVYKTVGGRIPAITASKSAHSHHGQFSGVVGVDIRVTDLAEALRAVRISPNTRVFVARLDGRLIAHPDLVDLERWPTNRATGELWMHIADVADINAFKMDFELYNELTPGDGDKFIRHDGSWIIGTATPISGINMPAGVLYMGVPARDFVGVAMRSELVALGVALVFVALILLLILWLSRYVAAPIVRLASIATTVSQEGLKQAREHPGSVVREIDEAGHAFNDMISGLKEKELIRELFGRYVPEQVAADVINHGGELQPKLAQCTILFADLAGFTAMVEQLEPRKAVDVMNAYFTVATAIIEQRNGVITQFQGDAILATFNLPIADPAHAANALEAAIEIQRALDEQQFAGHTLQARIGVNTGEVIAANVGAEGRFNYTVHGDAVNTAARLENANKQFGTRILVSETTERECTRYPLEPKGEIEIRGKKKTLRVFSVAEIERRSSAAR